jgi:hydroxymethylpyrimidine kinase/phosphomethylpyrimidine kinase/thiamine-phosphate diphosphorylase
MPAAHTGESALSTSEPGGRPIVWTIAGTDSGGGAGVLADARMLEVFDVHGAAAVAAITAQNSHAVRHVEPVPAAVLDAQLDALADDLPPRAIKTGLLGNVDNLRVVTRWVERLRTRSGTAWPALIVDPVLRATTGASFADEALRTAYRDELLPLATLATPNIEEARTLAPAGVASSPAALAAAWRAFGVGAVVVTGGDVVHRVPAETGATPSLACDWLDSTLVRGSLALPRIDTPHSHGTGCAFSSAAAAALALGYPAADAVALAKMATAEALRHGYPAGSGAGPVSPRRGFARRIDNLPGRGPSAAFAPLQVSGPPLYAIVDSPAWVARVLHAGVRLVQLRIKDAPHTLVDDLRQAIALARRVGAVLFVNDHWELALELGADGVHLGQDDLASAGEAAIAELQRRGVMLGISTHSIWEVCRAWALRPSYIAVGPVHRTTLKAMPWIPQGEANLAYWCRLLAPTPVVAVGGIDSPQARTAMHCGAAAAAVVSAISGARHPEQAIARLLRAAQAGVSPRSRRRRTDEPLPFPRPTLPCS